MLLGRLPNTIQLDAKGRLTVPSRIRDEVAGEGESAELHVGILLDKCLWLHTDEQHEQFLMAFEGSVDDTTANRSLKSLVYASFVPVTIDKAGRINVPQHLLEKSGIVKEVVVVGMRDRVELWGVEDFNSLHNANLENFRDGLEAALGRIGKEQRAARRGERDGD